MDNKTYLEQSERTLAKDYPVIGTRIKTDEMIDLLHAGIGMTTETGEFLDALKKHIWYGKELDIVNLREEIGDLLWYLALALRTLDSDFDTEMQVNINKLMARFPTKFTEHDAENRNLDIEREILEAE